MDDPLTKLFWFDTPWAFFGVVTTPQGFIIEAAPIAGWSVGKQIKDLVRHLKTKGLVRMGVSGGKTLIRQEDGTWRSE